MNRKSWEMIEPLEEWTEDTYERFWEMIGPVGESFSLDHESERTEGMNRRTLWLDDFPRGGRVLRLDQIPYPVESVDAVNYYDQNGHLQWFDRRAYLVDVQSKPARLFLCQDVWPRTGDGQRWTVFIHYTTAERT